MGFVRVKEILSSLKSLLKAEEEDSTKEVLGKYDKSLLKIPVAEMEFVNNAYGGSKGKKIINTYKIKGKKTKCRDNIRNKIIDKREGKLR